MNKINIIGAGYVGLANGLALASDNYINFIDNNSAKIENLKEGISPIFEKDIAAALSKFHHNLSFEQNYSNLQDYQVSLICLPTDYNESTNALDTSCIENELAKLLKCCPDHNVIIKSTVPIGFTEKIQKIYPRSQIFFSPEFLREGTAFNDAIYPQRLIISPPNDASKEMLKILSSGLVTISQRNQLILNSREAESIKIFSNAYLAMRVAFFNEIDNYCILNNLNAEDVIMGISKDSRIGEGYNNPSFGFGGYCLPKDTKQAESLFKGDPQQLFTATIQSNHDRVKFISETILKLCKNNIGIFRLQMKANSDNIRLSSCIELVNHLKQSATQIFIYEPLFIEDLFSSDSNVTFINNIKDFEDRSDLIVLNRVDPNYQFKKKIFTRDIFNEN